VSLQNDIAAHGFHLADGVLDAAKVADLVASLNSAVSLDSPHAVRNLLDRVPELRLLCRSSKLANQVATVIGNGARCVRALLFDKTPDANWKVAFHQDRCIAVQRRLDVPGFGPWSVKAGVPHVQPPVRILESMLTARIHLDDCGPDNGPLRVSPASHQLGFLDDASIERLRANAQTVTAQAGGVLYMRPLLLHASSAARSPSHRRVIHLEFAAMSLPGQLEWHAAGH
jgi:ectoine hydroxylase-related dioxygenase (phytanoyl-CoA dioxygenase family)